MKAISYLLALMLVLSFVACDFQDALNLTPRNEITEADFYTTETQFQQAVDDVYRQLSILYHAYGLADTYGELASDNTHLRVTSGFEQAIGPPITNWVVRSGNSRLQDVWEDSYRAIFISNNVTTRLEQTDLDIDPARSSRWMSEAKVVRALTYFNLVRAFGGVPLVTEILTPEEAYERLRASEAEVYQQIISDLTFARDHLPESYTGSDIGRITRYGAAGVLAKVYLTIGDDANAQAELEFIIESGRFSLVDDYAENFHYETQNNEESILEAQYTTDPTGPNANHHVVYKPFGLMPSGAPIEYNVVPGRGSGMNEPTQDLIDEFEEGDPRLEASIFLGFEDPDTGEWVDYRFVWKFYDPNFFELGSNFAIIRYADILLMYAEVTGEAEYLNQVRRRVGLPEWGTDDYPYDLYPTFEDAIEHERRVELAFEFHRTFDLARTGRLRAVLSEKGIADISEEQAIWPIPQNVIDVNPLITQNPGY